MGKHRKKFLGGDAQIQTIEGSHLQLVLKMGATNVSESLEPKTEKKKKRKKKKYLECNGEPMQKISKELSIAPFDPNLLNKFISYLMTYLKSKDEQGFFSSPVSDDIAPGYSEVIKVPMDFFTIKAKIEAKEYTLLEEFKKDVALMCNNAMSYNSPDTIYYEAALRLLRDSESLLSPEVLRPISERIPFLVDIPAENLGFSLNGPVADVPIPEKIAETINADSDFIEEWKTEDKKKKAESFGKARRNADGTTSLAFLIHSDGIIPGAENQRTVQLGSLIGKVKSGTGCIKSFRDERLNVAKAVYPLYYGAFSSHGPNLDSTFANLTKEETASIYSASPDSDLIHKNILDEILDNPDYDSIYTGDNLLDIITSNEHSKEVDYKTERETILKEKEKSEEIKTDPEIDWKSLKSLESEGIDVSFLDDLQNKMSKDEDKELLNKNAELLKELRDIQKDRLSAVPPLHYSHIAKPTEKEENLAAQIRKNLVDMSKDLLPRNVVPENGVRKLLGLPPIRQRLPVA